MSLKKVVILGSGAWGTAFAQAVSYGAEDVCIISRKEEIVTSINSHNINNAYFPHDILSKKIRASLSYSELIDADIAVVAVPSQSVREMLSIAKEYNPSKLIILSKGIENGSLKFMHELAMQIIARSEVAIVSGPNFAKYIIQSKPSACIIATKSESTAVEISALFDRQTFRTYFTQDILGVEICGIIKNIIAIASGICDGANFGENARAALITRALSEIKRFLNAFGCDEQTAYSLAGIGDLILTSFSMESRNYKFGFKIGKEGAFNPQSSLSDTVEGFFSAKNIYDLSLIKNVDMPICSAVYDILYRFKPVLLCATELMTR